MIHGHTRLLVCFLFFCFGCIQPAIAQNGDIFDSDIILIDVQFQEDAWHDTLANRKINHDKTPLVAVVTIDNQVYEGIEVRYKGNSSFHGTIKQGGHKLPLRFNSPKDVEFAGGYDKLRLSNNFRDPSSVRELLAYNVAGTYIPVPKVAPAAVTINGEYLGVYTVTEGISKRMLREYYCEDEGVLVKCDPQFDKSQPGGCPKGEFSNLKYLGEDGGCYIPLYDVEKKKEVVAIMDLARSLSQKRDPSTYLSVHEALWMHALNNVMVNLDSYLGIFCHNYYVYQDKDGIFHPLIWDLNLSFGGFATLAQQVNPDPYKLSPIVHDRYLAGKRPLIETLLKDRTSQLTYFSMITTIVNDWFESGRYVEEVTRWQEIIRPYREKESVSLYTLDDFNNSLNETVKRGKNRSIPGIVQLMETRSQYLLDHQLLKRETPEIIDWSVVAVGSGSTISLSTSSEITGAKLYYQEEPCGKWETASMTKLSNVSWEVTLEKVHTFYFVAITDSGVTLSPSNAPGGMYKAGQGS